MPDSCNVWHTIRKPQLVLFPFGSCADFNPLSLSLDFPNIKLEKAEVRNGSQNPIQIIARIDQLPRCIGSQSRSRARSLKLTNGFPLWVYPNWENLGQCGFGGRSLPVSPLPNFWVKFLCTGGIRSYSLPFVSESAPCFPSIFVSLGLNYFSINWNEF